jgi:hypothetical protein
VSTVPGDVQPPGAHFAGGRFVDDPDGDRFESRHPATAQVVARLNAATGRVPRRLADLLRAQSGPV